MSVLVWIEQSDGDAVASCWEVLGKGRELANKLESSLVALVMGDDNGAAAEAAVGYGADSVLNAQDDALATYRMGIYVDVLKQAISETDSQIVLMSATIRGRELSAAAACDLGAGLASDATDLRVEDGKLVATRTVYSGNILTDVTFSTDKQFASVRPRTFSMPETGATTGSIQPFAVSLNNEIPTITVVATSSTDTGEISLTDANLIVSGGRGVAQDPELGFQLVADLAKILGAAVGASRAAVDAG